MLINLLYYIINVFYNNRNRPILIHNNVERLILIHLFIQQNIIEYRYKQ
jgi:hypothetical protein